MRKTNIALASLSIVALLTSFQNCSNSLPANATNSTASSASSSVANAQCELDGSLVASGTIVQSTYAIAEAAVGAACPSAQALTCSNGFWLAASGASSSSLTQAYSSCVDNAVCSVGSATMPSGTSVTAYSAASVPYGSDCSSIATTLTCQNGLASASSGSASSYTSLTCATAAPPGHVTYIGDGNIAALFQHAPACSTAAGSACFTVGYQCYIVNGQSIGLYNCQ